MTTAAASDSGPRILERARTLAPAMADLLQELAGMESPTDDPASQEPVQRLLERALRELDFETRRHPGRRSGGMILAHPRRRPRGGPFQLLVGHTDTVWPKGTLSDMPVRRRNGRLEGPGTFDMKGGLVQMVFALRILRELDLEPDVTPVLFVNSDEEVGSPDSARWVERLARGACRAYVLEPSLGEEGMLKTARKGVGHFTVTIHGRPAHAGLNPEAGASAIVELAHVIQELQRLNDPERGTTVNVGRVEGGTRPNVVAPHARAEVDVRVLTAEDGARIGAAIRALRSATPGVRIEVDGGMEMPPLERTPRNRRLWEAARRAARELGLELREATAGGGSDGNRTSLYTATLDGLGPVGDGAHARHEHVRLDAWVERTALVARLLLLPPAAGDGR